jgi:asparagine synthase (glutamine-hydrolysing)
VPNDARFDRDVLAARVSMVSTLDRGATTWTSVRATYDEDPPAEPGKPLRSPDEAIAIVRAAIEGTVRRAVGGARRVAVLTGGGVDSAALLAVAVAHARATGGSAFGVALDFEGPGDDRPHLAALEAHLGCAILRVRPEEAAHRAASIAHGVDASPLAWPGAAMEIELLARARAEGAELALMGVGADALFDGDPRDVGSIRRARRLRGFAQPRSPVAAWVLRPAIARRIPRAVRASLARRRAPEAPAWAGPALASFLRRHHERLVAWAFAAERRRQDAPEREHLAWLRHQESIASGLVRRDPFDDAPLAATMQSVPRPWLLHDDVRRGLFRAAMRGLLPESLRQRTDKAGFEPAFTRFVEAAGGFDAFRDLARMTALADLGLVEPRRFAGAFDELAARPRESWGWGDVWPALAVEAFVRSHEERSGG